MSASNCKSVTCPPLHLCILRMVFRLSGEDVNLVQQLLTVDQRVGLLGSLVVYLGIRLGSRICVFHISQITLSFDRAFYAFAKLRVVGVGSRPQLKSR